eukprot:2788640-Rhodomonas_salina.1
MIAGCTLSDDDCTSRRDSYPGTRICIHTRVPSDRRTATLSATGRRGCCVMMSPGTQYPLVVTRQTNLNAGALVLVLLVVQCCSLTKYPGTPVPGYPGMHTVSQPRCKTPGLGAAENYPS